MRRIAIVLNAGALLILTAVLLRYLMLQLAIALAPFALALASLWRPQIASFHYATLIANAVAMIFGLLVVLGLVTEGLPVDSTAFELLLLAAALFYLLTPALNLVAVREVLLHHTRPTRPE